MRMKKMGQKEIEELCLTFEVASAIDAFGRWVGGIKSVELVKNGAQIGVTKQVRNSQKEDLRAKLLMPGDEAGAELFD